MSTASSVSLVAATDPRLIADIQTIDPYADAYQPATLQHGLTRDDAGQVQVKPDLAAELEPKTLARANRLLAADRLSEANSLVGCGHIQNVTSYCRGHEAEHAPVVCGKPLLHEACASLRARTNKFVYEHPELHEHLQGRSFQVLLFSIPKHSPTWLHLRHNVATARQQFKRFTRLFHGWHGWYWVFGFAHGLKDQVSFCVIHAGDRLPPWPTLNTAAKAIFSPDTEMRLRTYDGRDGDTQQEGLKAVHGGFVTYWMELPEGQELEVAEAFRDERLTTLYGYFRGFATSVGEVEREMPICLTCGDRHVPGHGQILLTNKELSERFDHIRPPSYGQRRMRTYNNTLAVLTVGHAPPP